MSATVRASLLLLALVAGCAREAAPAAAPAAANAAPTQPDAKMRPPDTETPRTAFPMVERSGGSMGTPLQLRLALDPAALPAQTDARANAAIDAAIAEVERLDGLLSEWKKGSPLASLNDHPQGGPVVLPPETFALLERALGWSKKSGGAFDPSFASLWGLWRFDPADADRIPTRAQARARARLIDYRQIHLDPATRRVRLGDPAMKIGLGGIAKGYAVDRVVALLRARGFSNFFVKFGGELFLAGTRGDRPWLVGVADPRAKGKFFATLAVENSAFTTSGDYEHFLIVDGIRYHHLIDPATGYPARGARGVSIVAPRAEDADALSTTCFVLGAKKALALVESLPGVEMVMVTGEGKVVLSSGLDGKIDLRALTPYTGP